MTKELEALEYINGFLEANKKSIEVSKANNYRTDWIESKRNRLETIKQALLKAEQDKAKFQALLEDYAVAEKKAKAFDIVTKKYVDMWILNASFKVEEYNRKITQIDGSDIFNLTQEEFELIKGCGK